MKIRLMMLPLLFAAGVALAEGDEREAAAARLEAVAVPDKAPADDRRRARHKAKSLPTGDLRHCLDLPSSAEIIRCAETGRKQ